MISITQFSSSILSAGLFAVISRNKIRSGLVGVSLTHSLEVSDIYNSLAVRHSKTATANQLKPQ